MSNFDVTIVFAVKNEEIYVESAVGSVLNQTGLRCEVVVVDDGSSDGTFGTLSRLAREHESLRLFRNPGAGKCAAFNYGVRRATGQFVCLFAGDDLMPAGSLAARWGMVENYPKDIPVVGLCKLLTMSTIKRFDGHLVPRRPGRGALSGVSPLMNRLVLEKIFPVPEMLPNEDTWMELAITSFPNWQVVHSDVVGCAWRVHEGNSINMLSDFDDYNKRITSRIRAVPLFYEQYGSELTEEGRQRLRAKIECEQNRIQGNIIRILSSKVGFVDKLRSLSIANRFFYGVRRKLYGILSGW